MDELTSYFFENYVVHGYGPADFRGMKADKIMAQIMELNPNEDREKAEAIGKAVYKMIKMDVNQENKSVRMHRAAYDLLCKMAQEQRRPIAVVLDMLVEAEWKRKFQPLNAPDMDNERLEQ